MEPEIRDETVVAGPIIDHAIVKFCGYKWPLNDIEQKFVRINAHTRDFDSIWAFMGSTWNIPVPGLILSINGGAKDMKALPRGLDKALKQGLSNVFSCTSAWVVTSGFSAGVAKLVGDASRDYMHPRGPRRSQLVVLGIGTWGTVYQKEVLEKDYSSFRFRNSNVSEDANESEESPREVYYQNELHTDPGNGQAHLDPYHTHFIFCDDGSEYEFGKEIQFRAMFEDFVARSVEQKDSASPIVQILIEGGKNTVKTCYSALKQNIPVVVVKYSGRCADLICDIYEDVKCLADNEKILMKIDERLQDYKVPWKLQKSQYEEYQKIFLDMMTKYKSDIFLFDMKKSANLKNAIFSAVCDTSRGVTADDQLSLAIKLDCHGLAYKLFENAQHKDARMQEALLKDSFNFVQSFLDNGFPIVGFLTKRVLEELYRKNFRPTLFFPPFPLSIKKFRKGSPKLLHYIGEKIQEFLGDVVHNPYSVKTEETAKVLNTRIDDIIRVPMFSAENVEDKIRYPTYPPMGTNNDGDIVRNFTEYDLFLWALLLYRMKLAKIFWSKGLDHMGSALVASALFKSFGDRAQKEGESDLAFQLNENAMYFEKIAVDILAVAYKNDKQMTHDFLLVRTLPYWSFQTCLSLAYQFGCMDFLHHPACRTKLNQIWMGGMPLETTTLKILLNLLLAPITISWIFPSRKKKRKNSATENKADEIQDQENAESIPLEPLEEPAEGQKVQKEKRKRDGRSRSVKSRNPERQMPGKQISRCKKLRLFYTAPKTKFIWNVISYLAFLCLFSYVTLIDLKPWTVEGQPSKCEIALLVWLVSLCAEEVRQIFMDDHITLYYKIKSWFSSTWNKFDLGLYVTSILALVLRFTLTGEYFSGARIVYSLVLSGFFLRFMQFYHAHPVIGPKVVMVQNMLTDLAFFLCIYILFIFAYGTFSEALRHPNRQPSWTVLKHVVYIPYWQTYGELFLEEVEGNASCTADSEDCTQHSLAAIFVFGLFLLLTNVLLLNLLIAMFGHTFQKVQASSEKLWTYHQYDLVKEYQERPFLPPPLIIIIIFYDGLVFLIKKSTSCCKEMHRPESTTFKIFLNRKKNYKASQFEKQCMEMVLREREDSQEKITHLEAIRELEDQVTGLNDNVISLKDEHQEQMKKMDKILSLLSPPKTK